MATTPEFPDFTLDMREQVARIDSLLAGVDQALANAAKLRDEGTKLRDEGTKLRDESAKLRRDRELAPWAVLFTGLGAGAALFAAGAAFMKLVLG